MTRDNTKKHRTVAEHLQFWTTTVRALELTISRRDSDVAGIDAEIQLLQEKRARIIAQAEKAPAMLERAEKERSYWQRALIAAQLVGGSGRSTVESTQKRKEKLQKKIGRKERLLAELAKLKAQL